MLKDIKKWYTNWFNTPYYHLLYKDRDATEAKKFMDNLTQYLSIQQNETILDLACGKGRHSVYLNSLGLNVTGIDLSGNSIDYAKKFENERLSFDVHDMTLPYNEKFNFVFNLFTSFGYFEDESKNLATIKAIKQNLKEHGIGVIDFFNVNHVIANLVPTEVKKVEGIDFHLKRYVENGFVIKEIEFTDKGEVFNFKEKVKALTLEDFQQYFEQAGLTLLEVFGDYKLTKYSKENSPRLVLIFQ